jgi:hypothetical protein
LNVEIFKNYFSQRKEKKRIFCEEKWIINYFLEMEPSKFY